MNPSADIISKITKALEEKKGVHVLVLDVRDLATYTDFMVLCSGTSTTHVNALVRAVEAKLSDEKPLYLNGSPDDSWWVLDFINVVVHVFKDEVRKFYDLEGLWCDAKKIEI